MSAILIISIIFLGLVFGSFGSVIFYRLGEWPTKKIRKGFLIGRSECPKCHHNLTWKNLFPVFSYIFQGGKCAFCKAPISRFYPFLEISTVIIFLSIYFLTFSVNDNIIQFSIFGVEYNPIFGFLMMISAWLSWLIILHDIKTYELHITASVFLITLSLIFFIFSSYNRLLQIFLGMIIFILIFVIIYYLGKLIAYIKFKENTEGFGLGDVILSPIIGARLVFFIQPNGVFERCYLFCFFIIFSCILGLIHYYVIDKLIWIINKKSKKRDIIIKGAKIIPFLPAMFAGFLLEIGLRNILINLLN